MCAGEIWEYSPRLPWEQLGSLTPTYLKGRKEESLAHEKKGTMIKSDVNGPKYTDLEPRQSSSGPTSEIW